MSNPYAQFAEPAPETAGNPYAVFQGGTGVDEAEQDVIHRTNNPALDTPSSFGLTDVAPELAKGFGQQFLSLPQAIGSSVVELGESLTKPVAALTMAGYAVRRMAGVAATDDEFKAMAGNFAAPKMLVDAGNGLAAQNKAWLENLNIVPKGGSNAAFDIGNGFGQIATTMGMTFITKNPAYAAAYMTGLINSQDYAEARAAGKTPEEARAIAAASAGGQGAIEALGGKIFLGAAKASGFMKKVLLRAAGQAGEEGTQAVVEETVKGTTGVRNTTMQEKVSNIAYQALLGFVIGAPVATVIGHIETLGQEAGMKEAEAQKLAQNLVANKDMLIDGATTLIDKEASGVLNNAPAQAEASRAAKAVIDRQAAVDKAVEEGTTNDPEIARDVLLTSDNVSRETRLTLQNLPTGFSMEQLRDATAGMGPSAAFQELQLYGVQPPSADYFQRVAQRATEGRITKLDDDIAAIDRHMNELLNVMDEREAQGKPTTKHENAMDALFQKREAMDEERAHLLTNDQDKNQRLVGNSPITMNAGNLMGLAKKSIAAQKRALAAGFREGIRVAKKNVQAAQEFVTELIQESGLTSHDKGKFISAIKNVQSVEGKKDTVSRQIEKIRSRVMELLDQQQRREAVGRIRGVLGKIKKSSTIAVDFGKKAEALLGDIDTKGRSPETIAALQKTLDFLKKNPDAEIPSAVLRSLELLNKRRLEDVSTSELENVAAAMEQKIEQGKTKLKLMQEQKKRLKERRLLELSDTTPLVAAPTKRARIGERLSVMDNLRNTYADFRNRLKTIGVATNPMDVFFDMLDGGKNYKGANYKIFKATVDHSFSRYLDLKESATRDVKNLTDKLDLDDKNFERIGAWAVLQQEGGEKKLLDTGYTQAELDTLELSKDEAKMYNLMRQKLDAMLPAIQDIMRLVYNKNVEGVTDYFPFMTDFEAAAPLEIQDQIGDALPQFGKKKNVEKGFTKSRTGGKQKVRIDALGVFLKHVDNAAYLVEMGRDIKELGDVAASEEYGKIAGEIGQEMVVDWIDALARKGNVPGRIPVVDALRRNVGFAMLGFKLSTILVQPTSLMDGSSLVGGTYVARGVTAMASDEWRQFLWNNMPEIRERAGDDPAYLDMGGDGVIGDVRRAGLWALKQVDALAASSVAAGAYMKAVEQKGGTVDLTKPDPDAIAAAQLMMRRTQSSGFAKDAPAIITQGKLTGNVSLDRLILQFQSFMFNRWSLIKHDMWALGLKQGNLAKTLNIATWMILANAAEVGVRRLTKEIVGAVTGDKPDEWEKTITKEAVNTTLGNVPFVSQVVNSITYGSVPVPAIAAGSQIAQQLKYAAQSKSQEKKAKHLASAAIIAAGTVAGIPGAVQAEQILRNVTKPSSAKGSSSLSTP